MGGGLQMTRGGTSWARRFNRFLQMELIPLLHSVKEAGVHCAALIGLGTFVLGYAIHELKALITEFINR